MEFISQMRIPGLRNRGRDTGRLVNDVCVILRHSLIGLPTRWLWSRAYPIRFRVSELLTYRRARTGLISISNEWTAIEVFLTPQTVSFDSLAGCKYCPVHKCLELSRSKWKHVWSLIARRHEMFCPYSNGDDSSTVSPVKHFLIIVSWLWVTHWVDSSWWYITLRSWHYQTTWMHESIKKKLGSQQVCIPSSLCEPESEVNKVANGRLRFFIRQ